VRNKIFYFIIAAVFTAAAVYSIWYFYFNIYEVDFSYSPKKKRYKVNDTITVSSIPLNAFGNLIKKREIAFEIEILNGKHLVNIHQKGTKAEIIFLSAGEVTIKCISKYALRPAVLEFTVVN